MNYFFVFPSLTPFLLLKKSFALLNFCCRLDDFAVEVVVIHAGVDDDALSVDAAGAVTEKIYGGIGDFLCSECSFSKGEFFCKNVILHIPRYACGCAGFEGTGVHGVEANFRVGTEGFRKVAH